MKNLFEYFVSGVIVGVVLGLVFMFGRQIAICVISIWIGAFALGAVFLIKDLLFGTQG